MHSDPGQVVPKMKCKTIVGFAAGKLAENEMPVSQVSLHIVHNNWYNIEKNPSEMKV